MKDLKQKHRKSNQGFSLFTVVVAVSFVGILGLLILYIAMANFQMKATDIKGKDGFYTAERALEEIRVGLQEDVGDAMSTAYIKVLETYSKSELTEDADSSLPLEEIRQLEFQKLFVQELEKRLSTPGSPSVPKQYDINYLRQMLKDGIVKTLDETKETLLVTNPNGKSPELVSDYILKRAANGVKLKNLRVVYVDPVGHASIIDTDIRLGIPEVRFPTPSTLPDLMNLNIVANKGIVCEAGNVNPIEVTGDVYAGIPDRRPDSKERNKAVSIKIEPSANLHLKGGNHLVCQGLIDVGKDSRFLNQGMGSLWARGIQVSSGIVTLTGQTYLADDLTVNRGQNSQITIEGSYHGFGSPDTARQSENNENFYKDATDTDLSSAILINGKNTTLDLSKATDITLAGRSYISPPKGDLENRDIAMGESLTVKGTQLAYLLPPELLGDGTYTNPMPSDKYKEDIEIKREKPVKAWGGRTLSQIGVDLTKPVEVVYQNDNTMSGKNFVYLYLNFRDDQKAAEFMEMVYARNPDTKKTLDKYLEFYFGANSGVQVNDSQSYLRYITGGNVLTYDGDKKSGDLNTASDTAALSSIKNEQINDQNRWYCLNQTMKSYVNKGTEVKDDKGNSHKVLDYQYTVFDNLINEEALKEVMKNHPTKEYTYTMDGGEKNQATFVLDNEFRITKEKAKKLRLVVSTGDVTIDPDVKFDGIIITKGMLTLGAGAHLSSNSREAMEVFQSQSANDSFSPKDIFWNGEDYVLGSSTSDNSGTKVSDFYDLAECVTYENWKKK